MKTKPKIDLIDSCVENNVLNIDKLLETKELTTIKYGLNNYPLTYREYLKNIYLNGELRKLYEWAVDNKEAALAEFIICKVDKNITNRKIMHPIKRIIDTENGIDEVLNSIKCDEINEKYFVKSGYCGRKSRDEVVEEIIKKFDLEEEKNNLVSDLTKEYFNKLFKEKNFELLTIKLCVRLEVVLRCDYYLEGTFEEMLTQYTNKYINDAKSNELLHKLRKYRNNIAHPTKNMEALSEDELLECIECVFKIG